MQPALENEQISKVRFVLDSSVPPIRRVWDDLVLQLIRDWCAATGRSVRIDERDGSGRIDLGPDGGDGGGQLLYQGPVAGLLKRRRSPTARAARATICCASRTAFAPWPPTCAS